MSCRLQIALDVVEEAEALRIAREVSPWVDILEAGTPLIKSVGVSVVRKLRAEHPEKLIVADMKSTDVGAMEAELAFGAGADITVASGVAPLATSEAVHRVAEDWGGRCLVDLTGVQDPVSRARQLKERGIGLVLYHRSVDEELAEGALWDAKACREVDELCQLAIDVSVAGGLDLRILPRFAGIRLYGLVVGRAITAQPDPAAAARDLSARVAELWAES